MIRQGFGCWDTAKPDGSWNATWQILRDHEEAAWRPGLVGLVRRVVLGARREGLVLERGIERNRLLGRCRGLRL